MWDRYIREQRLRLERVIARKIYWWILTDAEFVTHICGHTMNIKLPIPQILGNPKWKDEWKYKERNEAELNRVRMIWDQLTDATEEKKNKIEAGVSTVEKEFKEGILFEDGKYGLKYGGSWING